MNNTNNTFLLAGIIVVIIFFLLFRNPKDGTISNKYRRVDYVGSLIFAIGFFIFEGLSKIEVFKGTFLGNQIGSIFFLAGILLFTGFINRKYKNEINDYTSYQFGIACFISGWIGLLVGIIQLL